MQHHFWRSPATPRRWLPALLLVLVVVAPACVRNGDSDEATNGSEAPGDGLASACLDSAWPRSVRGVPTALRGDEPPAEDSGLFVWADQLGIHVRAVNAAEDAPRLRLEISSSARIRALQAEPEDLDVSTDVTEEGTRATAEFQPTATVAGVDFTACTADRVRIEVTSGETTVAPELISVGRQGVPALENPLDLRRQG